MFNKLKKLYAALHYYPKKSSRARREGLAFIQKITQNPALLKLEGFIQNQLLGVQTIKENFEELSEIMLDMVSSKKLFNCKDLTFHALASKKDSIHKKEVQDLIELGLQKMEQSKDPFHDISHIRRCINLAKVYFTFHRLAYKIDWGTLVLAIVFHDISRIDSLGILYRSPKFKFLEKIPFIVDAKLLKEVWSDAEKSEVEFTKYAAQYKLTSEIQQNVIAGILGTSFKSKKLTSEIQDNLYFKIVSDIDKLDMFTIGRFESALHNIRIKKMTSNKYFNRATYLVSWTSNSTKNKLKLTLSQPIFDFYINSLHKYGQKFYPKDAEVLGFKAG